MTHLAFSPVHCQYCGVQVRETHNPQYPRRQTCGDCKRRMTRERTRPHAARHRAAATTVEERAIVRWGRATAERRRIQQVERCALREQRRRAREAAKAARPQRTQTADWVARLRVELPDLYDTGVALKTLYYRAKYHLDPEFRQREMARLYKKKTEGMEDDGTITPSVLCRLFGDAGTCPYCRRVMRSQDKSLDHLIPRSRGGWHGIENVAVCCKRCNSKKRTRTALEFILAMAA